MIQSCVEFEPPEKVGFEPGRGSFHLEHLIDGKLVAVSVIDIMTDEVVYLFIYYKYLYIIVICILFL